LAVLGLLGFIGGKIAKSENPDGLGGIVAVGSVVGAVALIVLLSVFKSFHQVENGHIGIVKQFGALAGTTGDGVATTAPWQSLDEVSVQNELKTYDMTQNNSAVSSDSQPVFLVVQVNYSLVRDKAVDLYKETGGHYVERILDPAVFQNTKAATASYKAIDFAKNREQIRLQIEEKLTAEVQPHGIQINNVSLKNVDFTPALSKAIELTVEAEQNAKAEEQKVKIAEAQANQKVATAQGEADSTLVQARADAQSVLLKAQAEAKAKKLLKQQLTPLLVQQEAIQKLNPNVKVIVCAQNQDCVPQAFVQVDQGK
jgi:regulator of protease activity HflC (stomatin/prohibitin superfamily)